MVENYFTGKKIFITGGTGTFGYKIIEKLVDFNCLEIIVYSRDEYKQYKMKSFFPNVTYIIGDVRDYNKLLEETKNVNILFHAAAMKQIDTVENNPSEGIKTNIFGTENVIKAAINNNIEKIISISTDKCVEPINLYGATKMCLEKLIISANKKNKNNKFSILRYGNVISSRGSVLPLFLSQKKLNKFTVTDLNMTRFTMTCLEAINFTLNCAEKMIGGEIFVPKLKSYSIKQMINVISKDGDVDIIGIRPGEKINETLISSSESIRTIIYKNIFVIIPYSNIKSKIEYENIYGNNYKKEGDYNSINNEFISDSELEKIILKS